MLKFTGYIQGLTVCYIQFKFGLIQMMFSSFKPDSTVLDVLFKVRVIQMTM